jgi:thiamine-phosphate pyrophosphorylase
VSHPNNSPPDSPHPLDSKPILCYVTDCRSLSASTQKDTLESLLEKIDQIAAARVDWIQLREKDLSGRSYATLAREALRRVAQQAAQATARVGVLRPRPARILINDRLDVAIAEQAGGVHLGENSLRVEDAKRLVAATQATDEAQATHGVQPAHSGKPLPSDFLLGVSCHSLEAAQSAASAGVGYIFFGPVFATPSKAAYGAPQGLDKLAQVCASIKIPVLAIGGITLENSPACLSAGAAGLAAIRLFQDSPDPAATVRALHPTTFG